MNEQALHVELMASLSDQPLAMMRRVERHLGVMPYNYSARVLGLQVNHHRARGSSVTAEMRAKVRRVCAPFVEAAGRLLGIDLAAHFWGADARRR